MARLLNAPNTVTLIRLVASLGLFGLLLMMEERDPGWIFPLVAMILFILVVATDALDGYLARKYKQITDFGRIADPVVDKFLICGTFILIATSEWGGCVGAGILPGWVVVLIVGREFLVTGIRGFIEARGQSFAATWSGKTKMIFQSIAIPALFLRQVVMGLFPEPEYEWIERDVRWFAMSVLSIALLLTLYSGALYVVRAARILGSSEE